MRTTRARAGAAPGGLTGPVTTTVPMFALRSVHTSMAKLPASDLPFPVEIAARNNHFRCRKRAVAGAGAWGAQQAPTARSDAMFSVVGLLGAVAGSALVIGGAMVRRAMERSGLVRGGGLMPPGAAHEVS